MEKKKFERVNKEVVKRFAKSPFYHTPYQIYYESMKENQKEKERKKRGERTRTRYKSWRFSFLRLGNNKRTL